MRGAAVPPEQHARSSESAYLVAVLAPRACPTLRGGQGSLVGAVLLTPRRLREEGAAGREGAQRAPGVVTGRRGLSHAERTVPRRRAKYSSAFTEITRLLTHLLQSNTLFGRWESDPPRGIAVWRSEVRDASMSHFQLPHSLPGDSISPHPSLPVFNGEQQHQP